MKYQKFKVIYGCEKDIVELGSQLKMFGFGNSNKEILKRMANDYKPLYLFHCLILMFLGGCFFYMERAGGAGSKFDNE